MPLSGKTAIITGASRGIGEATAYELAAKGAQVFLTARSREAIEAIATKINKNGGKAFFDLQVPKAIISLKQGAGRLIRGEKDQGVLVICDRRITSKGYGPSFLKSLPDMKISHERQEALDFMEKL